MQTIVIVGGGAGGLELATRLGDTLGKAGKAEVVLVDRTPTHFWKPLLHTVASGKRDPQVCEIAYSAQAAEHGFRFVQGEVTGVDRAAHTIELAPRLGDDGQAVLPGRTLSYTRLVLAFGSVTNFFNVPGAAEHAFTLDSVSQADTFRKRFIGSCIQASERNAQHGNDHARVHIVIVGGGATGVELAAELSHSARELARYKVHTLDPVRDVRVSLLERGTRLLPHLPARLSQRAAAYLGALGVDVCTDTVVEKVDADGVKVADGRLYTSDITLWAAGVQGPQICTTLGLTVNHLKQIRVLPTLQTVDDADVFAIGDCASFVCPLKGAAPPRAQVAHQQAMFLAATLAAGGAGPMPAFAYRDYGSLVSLGPVAAVGVLFGGAPGRQMSVSGTLANWIYSLLYQKHLLALHGLARTLARAMADWMRARFTPPVKLH